MNIKPSVMAEIAKHPMIAGLKEASGNIPQLMEVARLCPDLPIYCGTDEINLAALACGAVGVISVISNLIPHDIVRLCQSVFQGNLEEARLMQQKMNPLIRLLFTEPNPIAVKTAMNLVGFNVGELRLPLTNLSVDEFKDLKKALSDYGILR